MNLNELATRMELDLDIYRELCTVFVASSAKSISRLRSGIDGDLAEEVSGGAHEIKGAALNLGFDACASLAADIETRASSGQKVPPSRVDELEEALNIIERVVADAGSGK